jgi:hypothetical protein
MSGVDLAEQILKRLPSPSIVLMTGLCGRAPTREAPRHADTREALRNGRPDRAGVPH